ncbi:Regulator of telomere elongation helicase 1 [Frankliniella fusca]|uniref:Regulator of telomere elongation helicase 1 n=1 Tax=Frankliniella fusca TaxID=407009 RepID=A0AAE1L6W4_9NEOP|nr:Regulator of telomere elongation helicase 1 [Frankliniella fusca]
MEKVKIHDTWVQFPFVPYPSQEAFMAKVLESLNGAKNALLESPTGTGKTLCLLCASLAWLDVEKKFKEVPDLRLLHQCDSSPNNQSNEDEIAALTDFNNHNQRKIYFCTRTHSQIMQIVSEFRNSAYQHLRTSVLASRSHLCIHPSAKKAGGNLDNKCRSLRQSTKNCDAPDPVVIPDIEDLPTQCRSCGNDHTCPFYTNFQEMKNKKADESEFPFTMAGAFDQISLIEKCKKYKVCPFYMSRHLKEKADIVFLPYSYIFNPHILRGLSIDLMNAVVIIDEGHNLEKVCEENASFSIQVSNVVDCIKELKKAKEHSDHEKFPSVVKPSDLLELLVIITKLGEKLECLEPDKAENGLFCILMFLEAGFTRNDWRRQLHNLKEVIQFCGEVEFKTDGMKKIHNVVASVFYFDSDCDNQGNCQESTLEKSFKLYKEKLKPDALKKGEEPIIYFWCFEAGVIMRSLQRRGVHSFIVTSGTLSPLQPLKRSLGIPFEVELINDHVIEKSQVLALAIGEVDDVTLEATYKKREENMQSLYTGFGKVVLEVATVSPKGLLIFFPSGKVKTDCLNVWTNTPHKTQSLFDAISCEKVIYEEPKLSSHLPGLQKLFFQKIAEPNSKGACLIGVLSGKVSEGIDFKDDLGRAVIMFGLPYPPILDPWVIHKRKHLRDHYGKEAEDDWYQSQAIRPVNQALGRIIRHQGDYGVVVLADIRFISEPKIVHSLPHWLQRAKERVIFSKLSDRLRDFFTTIPSKMKAIKIKTECQQENIRERHRKAMEQEECPSHDYHELSKLKIIEREREKKLQAEILLLEKRISGASAEIDQLLEEIAQTKAKVGVVESTYIDSDCESTGDGEWDEAVKGKKDF